MSWWEVATFRTSLTLFSLPRSRQIVASDESFPSQVAEPATIEPDAPDPDPGNRTPTQNPRQGQRRHPGVRVTYGSFLDVMGNDFLGQTVGFRRPPNGPRSVGPDAREDSFRRGRGSPQ